jgi:hypothetical protein
MKNKWIFFALAPLFSFAAVEEEWLSETTFPSEIPENHLKNKEVAALEESSGVSRARQRREERAARSKKSETAHRRNNRQKHSLSPPQSEPEALDQKAVDQKESQWSGFLDRLTLKKEQKKLNIVTNRKSKQYPYSSEEQTSPDALAQEEQEKIPTAAKERSSKESDPLKYHYRAREKISAESDKRTEEMALKRKSELLKKNNRRIQKEEY